MNGTKQALKVGGEVYDVGALAGAHGPLPIEDRAMVPGAAADAQLALYVGVCSVLVGGHDSRTTSSVFHHPQSGARVAREGDYPQVCAPECSAGLDTETGTDNHTGRETWTQGEAE